LFEQRCKNEAQKFFTAAHPSAALPASHSQQTLNTMRENTMTKFASIAAAVALFAPVAIAIFAQAAQIVA
jgi:hypothetical protein